MPDKEQPNHARFVALEQAGTIAHRGEIWHSSSLETQAHTSQRTVDCGLHIGCGIARVDSRGGNGERFFSTGTTFIAGCFEEPSDFVTRVSPGMVRCVGIRLNLDTLSGETLALAETLSKQTTALTQRLSPLVYDLAMRLTAPLPAYAGDAAAELYLEARGLELLAASYSLFLAAPQPLVRQRHLKLAQDARAYIDEHLGRDLTIAGLAREVGASDRVLTSAFREAFNETIAGYVTRRRMEHASQLIRQGQHVAEAAQAINYSPNALSAAFKQHYGVSPKNLRGRSNGKKNPDALKSGSPA